MKLLSEMQDNTSLPLYNVTISVTVDLDPTEQPALFPQCDFKCITKSLCLHNCRRHVFSLDSSANRKRGFGCCR